MSVQSQIDLKKGEIYAGTPVFLIVLPCLFVLEDSVCLRGSISRRRAIGNVLFGAVPSKGTPLFLYLFLALKLEQWQDEMPI